MEADCAFVLLIEVQRQVLWRDRGQYQEQRPTGDFHIDMLMEATLSSNLSLTSMIWAAPQDST
eukprot:scaffold656_cov403-Pavlova_lutheri.AAC.33